MTDAGAVARAAEFASLGHGLPLDRATLDRLLTAIDSDPDARVRAAALAALVRAEPAEAAAVWLLAVADPAAVVRRRAVELGPSLPEDVRVVHALIAALDDHDVTVVEGASWALGELGDVARAASAVDALATVTREHRDALAREAAVAALGALGDPTSLAAILDACRDKPAVRRRAVLALAPFDGPEVDAALDAALSDRDWQVRQAAEDLRANAD